MENTQKRLQIISETEALLAQQMQGHEAAIADEIRKQTSKAEQKLQEEAEDEGKLSAKDQRRKDKRDRWLVGISAAGGALLGLAVLPAIVLSLPVVAAVVTPVLGGGALTAITALLSAAAGSALGYGVGQAQAYFTPFTPKLDSEKREEIATQAKQKIEAERMGKVLCQLRLYRTSGVISHAELAESCEAIRDVARLRYGLSEEAMREFTQTALDARAAAKAEAEQKREEEKLKLEKAKAEKQEGRAEVKEDLVVEKLKQDIELEKKVVEAKISRGQGEATLQDILAKSFGGDGASSMPPLDMEKLMNLAMMRSMFGGQGGGASARAG